MAHTKQEELSPPPPPPPPYASTAVQLGAVGLLAGGFYYGVARQQRVEQEEAAKRPPNAKVKAKAASDATRKAVPVITRATLLERRLGLHRPVTPKAAALKALVGGTVVSVSGCAVLVLALGAALGVRNVTEFRERMEDVFPRMRSSVARAFHIKPKTPTPEDLARESAELRELAALFSERDVDGDGGDVAVSSDHAQRQQEQAPTDV